MAYTVKSGDTLSKIAAANGLSLSELIALNPQISNPNLIHPGDSINLASDGGGSDAGDGEGGTEDNLTEGSAGGGPANPVDMPQGGQLVKVNRPGQDPLWAMMYEWPKGSGQYLSYQFESKEQMEQFAGTSGGFITKSESWYNSPDRVQAKAPATELAGTGGNFYGLVDDITREAALDAGITDPTMVGKMMSDPDMQQILVSASIEGWSPSRIMAEQRQTDFWKNELYPGIENFYAGSTNPEQDYRDYVDTVNTTLSQLGYTKDQDGTYRSTVKAMLDNDVDSTTFVNMAPTYVKASQNDAFRASFDEWATETLGRNVTFDDWFDLLSGEGEVELALAAEQATIDYLSEQIGDTRFSGKLADSQIKRLANERNLTEDEIRGALGEIDTAIYSLYGRGLDKYGLNQDDIFSARTGVASRSGRSNEEINRKLQQAIREEGLADDDKLTLYTAYSESSGAPNRPGLRAGARQGA